MRICKISSELKGSCDGVTWYNINHVSAAIPPASYDHTIIKPNENMTNLNEDIKPIYAHQLGFF